MLSLNTYIKSVHAICTFKISGMTVFGPLEEKLATRGASRFLVDSLVNISTFGDLQ